MNREEGDYHVDEVDEDLDREKNSGSDRQKNRGNDYHRDRRGQHQLQCGYEHGVTLIDEKGQMMKRSHGVLVYSIRYGEDEDHRETYRGKNRDDVKYDETILEERLYNLTMEETRRIVG